MSVKTKSAWRYLGIDHLRSNASPGRNLTTDARKNVGIIVPDVLNRTVLVVDKDRNLEYRFQ